MQKPQSSKTQARVSKAKKYHLKQKDHMESVFHMVYMVPPTRFELVFWP
jgi:hypothetical protein